MAVHYRTQGLIIKKVDRGEADELLTVYTKDFGKLKILGRAVRKTQAKLRGGADLFYLSELEFIQGKTYKTLTDAVLINGFFNIRKELLRLRLVYQTADLLDDLVFPEQKDDKTWQLLKETFTRANNCQGPAAKYQLLYHYFFWNLVSLLGYDPELKPDSLCGKKIDSSLAKILKIIIKRDWPLLSRLKLEKEHLEALNGAAKWYRTNI